MSDQQPEQWTVNSLKDLITRIIESNDKRYEQRFEDAKTAVDIAFNAQKESVNSALLSAERAVLKAETTTEKRFDSVNEFRSMVSDQQATFMPRAEAEIVFKALEDKIDVVSSGQKIAEGSKKGSSETIAWIIAVVSIAATILSFTLRIR